MRKGALSGPSLYPTIWLTYAATGLTGETAGSST